LGSVPMSFGDHENATLYRPLFTKFILKLYNIWVMQLTILESLDMHFWYVAAVFVVRDRLR